MQHFFRYIFFFLIIPLIFSCANISSPTGGAKDEVPPKFLSDKSFPKNTAVNFKGNILELIFNEDIATNNLQDQLLITPSENNPYKFIVRRNRLRIIFEKNLSENTTYTLNFRDGIKDITEGNATRNLVLAFSTGPYMDSISVSGKVSLLKNNQQVSGALVSLYNQADTLNPSNSKPLYFTKTNTDGSYKILNVKNGIYNVYAIEDNNKNLKYEEPEKLAFINNVELKRSQKDINFRIATIDTKAPKVVYIKNTDELSNISLSEGVDSVTITSPAAAKIYYTINKEGKVISVLNSFEKTDSISLTLALIDSSGNKGTADIKIFFPPSTQEKKESFLRISFEPYDKLLIPGKIDITLNFSRSVTKSDLSKITLTEDTLLKAVKETEVKWLAHNKLQIQKSTYAKDSVVISILPKTFYSANTYNAGDSLKFSFIKEGEYGSIKGIIKTTKTSYIIELLDANFKLVERRNNVKSISFNYLKPGAYYLRAIEDRNNNGKWDQGNLKNNEQPEDIYTYKDKIELRANWEIVDIIFQF
ncbi:MAG: Ig-like domain-containing protein [Cytophagaceae bacterium]|nr:Ig-like domain-containing protein [Cytophagaceae bacterium]